MANDYQKICQQDLAFLQQQLKANSAAYVNQEDHKFHQWFAVGYQQAQKLIEQIADADDCYYIFKYYINGFGDSHFSVKRHISLPEEQYPGFLIMRKSIDGKNQANFKVIYRHPELDYLGKITRGDRVTHINNMEINTYYERYIKPFYAQNNSAYAHSNASIYSLIIDGNRFKPIARQVTVTHQANSKSSLKLRYTNLTHEVVGSIAPYIYADQRAEFKVEAVSKGIWITIPNFHPVGEEAKYFDNMLQRLRLDLAQRQYILFDLRGNMGGLTSWSRPIIRNLWGDQVIKSLGSEHDFNQKWMKKIRVSQDNLANFSKKYAQAFVKAYKKLLARNKSFFLKKWDVFQDHEHLYSNKNNLPLKSKIYVLTDQFCRSTCWHFVNELRQMGAVHLGKTTNIETVYSYAKSVTSPSKNFDFYYPTELWIAPNYKLGAALVPHHIFPGDLQANEILLTNWLISLIEQ